MSRKEEVVARKWDNPRCRKAQDPNRAIAIIGCGKFAYSTIAYYLKRQNRAFLRATLDTNSARARSLCEDFGGAYATTELDDILSDPLIRLVYIASNHASHAEYAIACLDAGKDVHIEKPQVVSSDQLERLLAAQERNPERHVFLGYNRPKSPHFEKVRRALAAETGPIMVNWFVIGHDIPPDHWYFDEAEGGRVLGNLCHWTDLTLAMVGSEVAFPAKVSPGSAVDSPSDLAVVIQFADQSVAGITFSAKGYTFEGIREVLNVHRGDALISVRDFHETRVEVGSWRSRFKTRFRDHGHGANIVNSYRGSLNNDRSRSVTSQYNRATANLVLAVREAVDSGQVVTVA